MYIPAAFQQTKIAEMHDLIERASFGVLISQANCEPLVTHLPFLLNRADGDHGSLLGHFAKANEHWQHLIGQTVLAVFSGPHAYISPSWYQAEHVVPTWNYVAVHAYGTIELVNTPTELFQILNDSVAKYESSMPKPWSFDQQAAFIDRLAKQIVGFRLNITRLEGKWKLSQNHPLERREKVMGALSQQGEESQAVAAYMRQAIDAGQ